MSWQFYDYNFQMFEVYTNLPSNQEISFKLTQNLIPSFAQSNTTLIPLQSSLQYTHSRISIQNMLEQGISIQRTQGSGFSKNSSLKVSQVNTTTQSSLKHSQRTTFRQRTVSNRENGKKSNINRRLSFHLFEFQQQKTSLKSSLIHVSERKRSWSGQESQSNSSKKQRKNTEKGSNIKQNKFGVCRRISDDEDSILFNLKNSMNIKQIKLRADEQREKNYLKRILQARICNVHVNEAISKSTPLWISRKTFNRF